MRRRAWVLAAAGLLALGMAGCAASKKETAAGGPKVAAAASITAAADLNTFNNQPHTVVLVFYQLSDPNVFKQFTESPEGLGKLLEGESFDPSVLSRRRIVMQPGQTQELSLDLAEGARYVGVVGGFYGMRADGASRLFPVELKKKGMLWWSKTEPMGIRLELGRSGIVP